MRLPLYLIAMVFSILGVACDTPLPENDASQHDSITELAVDSENGDIIIAGTTTGSLAGPADGKTNFFIGRLDPDGAPLWLTQTVSRYGEIPHALQLNENGEIWVTGQTALDARLGCSGWLREYTATGQLTEELILTTRDGSSLVIHDDQSLETGACVEPTAVAVSAEGLQFLAGNIERSQLDSSGWLAAYHSRDRLLVWQTDVPGPGETFVSDLSAGPGGLIHVVGHVDEAQSESELTRNRNAWIAQYNETGQLHWKTSIPGNGEDKAISVASTPEAIFVAGVTSGKPSEGAEPNSGSQDAWLARYDLVGRLVWLKHFGKPGMDQVAKVLVVEEDVLVFGVSGNQSRFGGDGQPGRTDCRVIRFSPASGQIKQTSKCSRSGNRQVFDAARTDRGFLVAGDRSAIQGKIDRDAALSFLSGRLKTIRERFFPPSLPAISSPMGGASANDRSDLRRLAASKASNQALDPLARDAAVQATDLASSSVAGLTRYLVLPSDTDAAISKWNRDHVVYLNESQPTPNRLLIHLSGSYGQPANSQMYLQSAASSGVYAIGLHYPNNWTVGSMCSGQRSTSRCFTNLRQEIITGEDTSSLINVDVRNSIINRIQLLLTYLSQNQPDQGWDQFLDGDGPKWDSIVISGHSQGGGHAAFIGQVYQTARVVLLASPDDIYSDGTPASWQTPGTLTPITGPTDRDRIYSFISKNDFSFQNSTTNWGILGLQIGAGLVKVSATGASIKSGRAFVTQIMPQSGSNSGRSAHGSVATDAQTPLDNANISNPTYRDAIYYINGVWPYLCCGG